MSLVAFDTAELSIHFSSHAADTDYVDLSDISKLTAKVEVHSFYYSFSSSDSTSSVTVHLTTYSMVGRLAARIAEVDEVMPFDASSFGGHSPLNEVVLWPADATTEMTTTYTLLGPGVDSHSATFVQCVFYIDRSTVRLPGDTAAVVAPTALVRSE